MPDASHVFGASTLDTARKPRFTGARADEALAADFIVAPEGPLTLQDARVLTHRVSVSIPIR